MVAALDGEDGVARSATDEPPPYRFVGICLQDRSRKSHIILLYCSGEHLLRFAPCEFASKRRTLPYKNYIIPSLVFTNQPLSFQKKFLAESSFGSFLSRKEQKKPI